MKKKMTLAQVVEQIDSGGQMIYHDLLRGGLTASKVREWVESNRKFAHRNARYEGNRVCDRICLAADSEAQSQLALLEQVSPQKKTTKAKRYILKHKAGK